MDPNNIYPKGIPKLRIKIIFQSFTQKQSPALSEDFAMASPAAMWDQDSGIEIMKS